MKTAPQATIAIATILLFLACATKVESVALAKSDLTIAVGESETLRVAIQPTNATDQAVTWQIDNADIARISTDGIVTAVAIGTATVTAITRDGGKMATCVLTAIPNVVLDYKAADLNVGDTLALVASTHPANAFESGLSWSSSDDAVATVDGDGNVKAISQGSATITATVPDGGRSASCNLTIVVPVKSVALDKAALTLNKGSSKVLNAKISPADATNRTLTWSSNDPSVARVDSDGEVRAISKGKATVTVTSNVGRITASCIVTVVLSNEEWISLVESEVERMISFFAQNCKMFGEVTEAHKTQPSYALWKNSFWQLYHHWERYLQTSRGLIRVFRIGIENRQEIRRRIILFHEDLGRTCRTMANFYRQELAQTPTGRSSWELENVANQAKRDVLPGLVNTYSSLADRVEKELLPEIR